MKEENCIFCKIANGEIPSSTVYEDDDFRVILDLGPASKGHALILPKEHYKDICEADMAVTGKILPLDAKIGSAMKKGLGASGFNVVQNNGTSAGQTVFHFHMHLVPRFIKDTVTVTWGPGQSDNEELDRLSKALRKRI